MPESERDDPWGSPPRTPAPTLATPPTPEDVGWAYAARVYAVAVRLLGSEADAEAATRDVLPRLVRRLDAHGHDAAVPTWVYRVALDAVLARRRDRADGRLPPSPAPAAPHHQAGGPPGTRAGALPLPDRLERAVATLPDLYRDPFVLVDIEGLPEAEVAGLLGLSPAAVRGRLHRARLLLRAALRARP